MVKVVTLSIAGTLAALAIILASAIALTVMEDGSGRLGNVNGWHISYCLPSHPCDDS